jgi:preprotein translocase subunit SecY
MPVIFAMSLLSFPQLIGKFLISKNYSEVVTTWAQRVLDWIANPYIYNSVVFIFIVAFAFFYLTVVFNTDELAENLQKQGAFIQGVRPGNSTSDYLRKVSFRLTSIGAIFLALISILPNILIHLDLMSATVITGTGLLIVIGVILDMKRQVESLMVVRSYDKYL